MSKKLHAKDLKRDELVETLGGLWGPAVHWFEENKKLVIWSIGGFLVLVLGVGALGSMGEASDRAGQAALGESLALLADAELAATDPETDGPSWEEVRASFAQVADQHGGVAGSVARHYVGVAQLRAGDAAGAVASLNEAVASADDDWQRSLSLSVLAAAQERAGDVEAAEASLKRLREEDMPGYPADAATMDLARFYERQGRLDEARELYSELVPPEPAEGEALDLLADPPSVYAGQARSRLDELEG